MEYNIAKNLSRKLQISIDRIVREEKEIMVLDILAKINFLERLVLKGGSCLRLAYQSPRFSDDLDFALRKPVNKEDFFRAIKRLEGMLPGSKISDLVSKRFTLLAELKFREGWLKYPYSLKIEISKREIYTSRKDYELKLISSSVSHLNVLVFIASLERIKKEKYKAISMRNEPRDLFDLWFISQKLQEPFKLRKKINIRSLNTELRKFLPRNYWYIIPFIGK